MSKKGIGTFELYLKEHLREYRSNDGNVYVVFHDPDHKNMEPFYRIQMFGGNCFLQAPFLLHWYLCLWFDKEKAADDVFLIDLSKFVRKKLTGKALYDYIFEGAGGDSLEVLVKLTGSPRMLERSVQKSHQR